MFIGEHSHSIDNKGRYIVPARCREELGERFYVTKGLDHCLFVYTETAWQAKLEELNQLSSTKANSRRFIRKFFAGALEAMPDKQFRIVIPPSLREHAQIEPGQEIVTIGLPDRLEIWSQASWQAYNAEGDDDYEAVAEELADIRL